MSDQRLQIRAARIMLDWTADDLAEAARISVGTVRRIDRMGVRSATFETIDAILSALGQGGVALTDPEKGRGPGVYLKHALPEPARRAIGKTGPIALQIRAARAFLDWTADDLAEAARISVGTVRRIDRLGVHSATFETFDAIGAVLSQRGVALTDPEKGRGPGVYLKGSIKSLGRYTASEIAWWPSAPAPAARGRRR